MASATPANRPSGSVEKSRQRRSRHFSVLTYCQCAPRAKMAVALLDEPFDKLRACFFEPTRGLLACTMVLGVGIS